MIFQIKILFVALPNGTKKQTYMAHHLLRLYPFLLKLLWCLYVIIVVLHILLYLLIILTIIIRAVIAFYLLSLLFLSLHWRCLFLLFVHIPCVPLLMVYFEKIACVFRLHYLFWLLLNQIVSVFYLHCSMCWRNSMYDPLYHVMIL